MGKLHVPISQLGAMRDASSCVVMVRGAGDDIELQVSRKQFRDVLECYGPDTAEESWTVTWRAQSRTAVLDVSDGYDALHIEEASQCDHCTDWYPPEEVKQGEDGDRICDYCWGAANAVVDRYGGRTGW